MLARLGKMLAAALKGLFALVMLPLRLAGGLLGSLFGRGDVRQTTPALLQQAAVKAEAQEAMRAAQEDAMRSEARLVLRYARAFDAIGTARERPMPSLEALNAKAAAVIRKLEQTNPDVLRQIARSGVGAAIGFLQDLPHFERQVARAAQPSGVEVERVKAAVARAEAEVDAEMQRKRDNVVPFGKRQGKGGMTRDVENDVEAVLGMGRRAFA